MDIAEWIAVGSVVLALVALTIEQRLTRQQAKVDARDRHYDRTQTLLLTALDDPELLEAISGTSDEDQKYRRYRQLWFNHVEMFFRNRYLFDRIHWKGTINDIRGFLNMPAMLLHWENHRQFYSGDFRSFIDKEIVVDAAEAPQGQAPAADEVQASKT